MILFVDIMEPSPPEQVKQRSSRHRRRWGSNPYKLRVDPECYEWTHLELDQICRAAEIGVSVKSASETKLVPLDDESREPAETIEHILEA